jgi:hypothetical protein
LGGLGCGGGWPAGQRPGEVEAVLVVRQKPRVFRMHTRLSLQQSTQRLQNYSMTGHGPDGAGRPRFVGGGCRQVHLRRRCGRGGPLLGAACFGGPTVLVHAVCFCAPGLQGRLLVGISPGHNQRVV